MTREGGEARSGEKPQRQSAAPTLALARARATPALFTRRVTLPLGVADRPASAATPAERDRVAGAEARARQRGERSARRLSGASPKPHTARASGGFWRAQRSSRLPKDVSLAPNTCASADGDAWRGARGDRAAGGEPRRSGWATRGRRAMSESEQGIVGRGEQGVGSSQKLWGEERKPSSAPWIRKHRARHQHLQVMVPLLPGPPWGSAPATGRRLSAEEEGR